MKKVNVLYLLLAVSFGFFACRNELNQYHYDKNAPGIDREIISNPGQENSFKNGDLVSFDPTGISKISQVITPSSSPTALSNVRDFSFKFTTAPMPLSYTVSMTSPGEDWVLCRFDDNVWVELTDAVYSDDTNKVNIELSIPMDTDIRNNEYSIKIAFVKSNEFIKNLDVKKNPYDNNPFGALITFDSAVPVVPATRLLGKHNNDIVKVFSAGTSHNIDVLGLYNNFNNTVWLDATYGRIVFRQVLEIPVNFDINFSMETSFASGFVNDPEELYIISTSALVTQNKNHFGFDQHGEIRWAKTEIDLGWRLFPIVYEGRNVLAMMGPRDNPPLIILYEMSGKYIRRYDNFNDSIIQLSHEITNVGTNTIAVKHSISENNNMPYDESMITEIDLVTGAVIRTLDINNIYDPNRSTTVLVPTVTDNGRDRTHLNSLIWNSKDDTYLVSARHQGVMKFKGNASTASDLV